MALAYTGDDCLEWPFNKAAGYAVMPLGRTTVVASRHVCERKHGAPPSDAHQAAHACGNRICINPRHIRWKTKEENEADKVAHGTAMRGARNHHSSLTQSDVLAIRASNERATILAQRYSVSSNHIWAIRGRRAWAWLA